MIDKTYLESVCAAQSLPFSPELSEKLDQYAQLLVEWNEKMTSLQPRSQTTLPSTTSPTAFFF